MSSAESVSASNTPSVNYAKGQSKTMPSERWRVLEFFAGIGGLACAWPEADIAVAVDINQQAAEIYRRNFSHTYLLREIAALDVQTLGSWQSNFWWMSPPCQPFSRRGHRRDDTDARTAALLHLIDLLQESRPPALALENVIGFEGSRTHARLMAALQHSGYHIASRELCPSELGWPNRRPRFYLLAACEPLQPWQPLVRRELALQDFLDPPQIVNAERELWLGDDEFDRFSAGLDRVDARQSTACTACFASSYGKTRMKSGSYLWTESGYRRFTPREVARLLGFPDSFQLHGISARTAWKLLGNSLALPAVRYVLSHLPP